MVKKRGNEDGMSSTSIESSAGALAISTRSHTGSLHDANPEEVAELQGLNLLS